MIDKTIQEEPKVLKFTNLKEGDKVVLPPNGVGVFQGKIKIEIDGAMRTFFKVKFEIDGLETMIPEERYTESGIRKIISKQIAARVMDIFTKPPKHQKGPWNKKMQEYDAKIHSGVLISVAEVVRDGFSCSIDPNKSYTERAKYKKALDIASQELAIVFDKTYDDMEKEIIDILRAKQVKNKEDEFTGEDVDTEEGADDFNEDSFFAAQK